MMDILNLPLYWTIQTAPARKVHHAVLDSKQWMTLCGMVIKQNVMCAHPGKVVATCKNCNTLGRFLPS